ncbi:Mu transposase domain-containing protein [Streptomyces shenzhenensis]
MAGVGVLPRPPSTRGRYRLSARPDKQRQLDPWSQSINSSVGETKFREQISVRTNRYSVPVRFIDRTVSAMLHASELVVYDGRDEIARHERLIAKVASALAWTTTWRPWSASPVVFQAPLHSNRPVQRAGSPRSMTLGGRRPTRFTATGTAPGH